MDVQRRWNLYNPIRNVFLCLDGSITAVLLLQSTIKTGNTKSVISSMRYLKGQFMGVVNVYIYAIWAPFDLLFHLRLSLWNPATPLNMWSCSRPAVVTVYIQLLGRAMSIVLLIFQLWFCYLCIYTFCAWYIRAAEYFIFVYIICLGILGFHHNHHIISTMAFNL